MEYRTMNRKSKIVLSIIGGIGIIVVVAVIGVVVYAYLTNRTLEQTLATNLSVSGEWIEISPEPLLKTRRMVSEIAIAIPNYSDERGVPIEIKLKDGRVVKVQIQAVNANGTVFELRHSGFNYTGTHDLIIFTPQGGFPDGEYKTVRIKSDQPFNIERMFWRERNLK